VINKKIIIIDYQLGNLFSVNQCLKNIGIDAIISSNPEAIKNADALVLPGVGAYSDAMENLKKLGQLDSLKESISQGKPLLGICLGLQMLFDESEEFGKYEGLGIISGTVRKFPVEYINNKRIKIPQIAWNSIFPSVSGGWLETPLEDIKENEDFYFVHSFYVVPEDENIILSKSTYGNTTYASSILSDNIFACQFHPEKSAKEGIKIYKKWAKINKLI
jgi:glutamine amidotransferase